MKQSGRTPWRAATLCEERSNVPRDSAVLYGVVDDVVKQKNDEI